jgi:pentatricopeptide repeat protein
MKAMKKGQEVHAKIMKEHFLQPNVFIGNALMGMYVKCGELMKAQEVFDELAVRDVVSWNTLIGGYAQHGYGDKALDFFKQMRIGGISPTPVTFVSVLKACGIVGDIARGEEIHDEVVSRGLLGEDVMVGNALVDMYAKCGVVSKAREAFDKLPIRNTVTWNALIAGYVQHGHAEEAMDCCEGMKRDGFSPDVVTFGCLLKLCSNMWAITKGREIHGEIVKGGLLDKSLILCNALVEMYATCGALYEASEVFEQLPGRDAAIWTTLIARYAQHGHGEEPLVLFGKMQDEGISPTPLTFVSALKACANIGASGQGQAIHARIDAEDVLRGDILLGTALVDMYAKCGELAKAREAFERLPVRDVVSWSALIGGYALLGNCIDAPFDAFQRMSEEGIVPNSASFSSILKLCSNAGLLDAGKSAFETMIERHSIAPTLEHYTCLIDLICRAGLFAEAVGVIERMPFHGDLTVWHALSRACRTWGNARIAKLAFEQAMLLDGADAAAYVSMSNALAESEEPIETF